MTLNYVKRKTLDHQALRHNFFFTKKTVCVDTHTSRHGRGQAHTAVLYL